MAALCSCTALSGQSSDYNALIEDIVERYHIKYGISDRFHSSIRSHGLKFRATLQNSLDTTLVTKADTLDLAYLTMESWPYIDSCRHCPTHNVKSGIFNVFYKTPYDLFRVDHQDFKLSIDPVIHWSLGSDAESDSFIFQNTRGLKVRGLLDSKIYFYTAIFENQRRFLAHIEDRIIKDGAIPGQGFYRTYESSIIDGIKGWDYLNAQAFIHFPISKSVGMELGHGSHFIGDGVRSFMLSDYAHNFFYVKFNTVFWKIHYQNIFAELSAESSQDIPGDQLIPKKYMAMHYLSINLSKKLRIGIFESIVFGRENHFELQYLNPVILYRSVEQFLNSPDNVLFGLDFSLRIKNQLMLYGQWVIDEMKVGEVFRRRGWWGNKSAFQLGTKWKDAFGISRFDILLEYNAARPYTYAHRTSMESPDLPVGSYSHFRQPLAHPLGANFHEVIFLMNYRVAHNTSLGLRSVFADYGDDPPGQNWGSDILKDYLTREGDFNNSIGQGINRNVYLFALNASHAVFYNFFIDLTYLFRTRVAHQSLSDLTSHYIGIGLRANVFEKSLDH